MKKKPPREWDLWVFKPTGQYLDFGETPKIGGVDTCRADFEIVRVREVVKRRPKKRK